MIKNKTVKTVIAFAKNYPHFCGIISVVVFVLVVFGLCMAGIVHAEETHPVSVSAKKAKVNKTGKTPSSSAKKASGSVITIIYEGAKKPVSFDRDGNATYHEEMIPVMKAVVLPSSEELMDVKLATRREPVVEGHVVMRLVAHND
jgi:ribosomal protein L25 (general stress protein Ctc)